MDYQIGQVVQGVVTGIQPYGAFVRIEDIDGLIHISEISDGYVNDIRYYVVIGEKVVVKIIDIDKKTGQLRLSLKAIQPARRSRRSYRNEGNVPSQIGFESLKQTLPLWIEESVKEL